MPRSENDNGLLRHDTSSSRLIDLSSARHDPVIVLTGEGSGARDTERRSSSRLEYGAKVFVRQGKLEPGKALPLSALFHGQKIAAPALGELGGRSWAGAHVVGVDERQASCRIVASELFDGHRSFVLGQSPHLFVAREQSTGRSACGRSRLANGLRDPPERDPHVQSGRRTRPWRRPSASRLTVWGTDSRPLQPGGSRYAPARPVPGRLARRQRVPERVRSATLLRVSSSSALSA